MVLDLGLEELNSPLFRYGGVQRGRTTNTCMKLMTLLLLHIIFPFFLLHSIYIFASNFNLASYTNFGNTRPMTLWRSLHVPVVSFVVDFFNFLVMIVIMIATCVTGSSTSDDSNFYDGPEVSYNPHPMSQTSIYQTPRGTKNAWYTERCSYN